MRAVRLVPTHRASHAAPLIEKFVGSSSPELLLMNTEGVARAVRGYRA